MALKRRNMLLSVPLMMGVTGCSAVTGSESPSLQILIFNASEEVEQLEYSITNGESTIASASIQVAPTPGGNHYTIQSNGQSLQRGDEPEIEVLRKDYPEDAIENALREFARRGDVSDVDGDLVYHKQ